MIQKNPEDDEKVTLVLLTKFLNRRHRSLDQNVHRLLEHQKVAILSVFSTTSHFHDLVKPLLYCPILNTSKPMKIVLCIEYLREKP